jgi:hypothetical protein
MAARIRWASKVRVDLIVRLYTADASGRRDDDLVDEVGWRLLSRSQDVLLVSDSKVVCPDCGATFPVPWIGRPAEDESSCPDCGWTTTAGEYHSSFEHRGLYGVGAREAFAEYVAGFPRLRTYTDKMLAIDRLVHAVHTTGGLAARNLFEGRARETLAALDSLAGAS